MTRIVSGVVSGIHGHEADTEQHKRTEEASGKRLYQSGNTRDGRLANCRMQLHECSYSAPAVLIEVY